MSALVFEARWHRIQRSREQGFEELSDFLGRYASVGPLVRCGLVRKREEWSEFQRYHGYPRKRVNPSCSISRRRAGPGAAWKERSLVPGVEEPHAAFKGDRRSHQAQFAAVEELRAPVAMVGASSADQHSGLLAGFMVPVVLCTRPR